MLGHFIDKIAETFLVISIQVRGGNSSNSCVLRRMTCSQFKFDQHLNYDGQRSTEHELLLRMPARIKKNEKTKHLKGWTHL